MKDTAVRILGIDPGSRVTGYGIIDSQGQTLRCVAVGCIRGEGDDLTDRLRDIFFGVRELVETYVPGEIAVERAFVHKNVESALKLGQARAAAICGAFLKSLRVHEYTPREVKLAVTGRGGADKEQVQHMMRVLLGLKGELQPDGADALAVAVCHAHSRGLKSQLGVLAAGGERG